MHDQRWHTAAWEVVTKGDPRSVRLFAGFGALAWGLTVIFSPIVSPLSALEGATGAGVGALTVLSGLLLLARPLATNGRTVTGGILSSSVYCGITILIVMEQGGWGRAATVYAGLCLTAAWLVIRAAQRDGVRDAHPAAAVPEPFRRGLAGLTLEAPAAVPGGAPRPDEYTAPPAPHLYA
jgi:hypothetical protein